MCVCMCACMSTRGEGSVTAAACVSWFRLDDHENVVLLFISFSWHQNRTSKQICVFSAVLMVRNFKLLLKGFHYNRFF